MIANLLLIIIYLSFISLGLPDALLGSAWPAMNLSLSVPWHYAGIISMIIASGTVVSSLFSGQIIRRIGTGTVTLVSVFLTAIALVGFSFSRDFFVLCIWAVPLGLGAGSVDSALNNYVALHYKAKHMNWLHSFWGVGASIGPLIMSVYLTNGSGWTSGYRTIGVIQLSLVAVLIFSLPLWGKIGIYENKMQTAKQKKVSYKKLMDLPGLKLILFVFFLYCTIEAVTGLWGSSYLVTSRGISPEIAARWIAFYYIGITGGRFLSGFLSIKLNNRQMVRAGQSLIACGVIMLLLPFNSILLTGFFIIGLGCAPIFPSLLHETPDNFSSEFSQTIMGMQMASAYVGTTIMPPLFGRLATDIDFSILPIFIGLTLIVKIVTTEIVNKKIHG